MPRLTWLAMQVVGLAADEHVEGLPDAIIEVEGSAPDLVMLTTKPAIPLSIHQITSCSVYPLGRELGSFLRDS